MKVKLPYICPEIDELCFDQSTVELDQTIEDLKKELEVK